MFSLTRNIFCNQLLGPLNKNVFNQTLSLAENVQSVRLASKKAGGSTKNRKGHARPKHRRIHYNDGCFVPKGTMLVTQNKLRFHPGLNVGFGKNATLFALEAGRVVVTCEKIDPDMDHNWVKMVYGGRELDRIYKKYFHIIPEKQHCRFLLT